MGKYNHGLIRFPKYIKLLCFRHWFNFSVTCDSQQVDKTELYAVFYDRSKYFASKHVVNCQL